jgi:carbonic anhydrase
MEKKQKSNNSKYLKNKRNKKEKDKEQVVKNIKEFIENKENLTENVSKSNKENNNNRKSNNNINNKDKDSQSNNDLNKLIESKDKKEFKESEIIKEKNKPLNNNENNNKSSKDIQRNLIISSKNVNSKQNIQEKHESNFIKKENKENLIKNSNEMSSLETQENNKNNDNDNIPAKEIKYLLESNKKFVKVTSEKNPKYFKEISSPQNPKYLILSCSDSRIQINNILSTNPGEIFIHRNIGNLVNSSDLNIQSVICYAIENLNIKHVIVLGHTDCGAIKACLSGKCHELIDHWLYPIKEVVEKDKTLLKETLAEKGEENLYTKLCELNIKQQVLNLCKNPIVQKAWNRGNDLYIYGLLYDMKTGYLKDLNVFDNDLNKMKNYFNFEFTGNNTTNINQINTK